MEYDSHRKLTSKNLDIACASAVFGVTSSYAASFAKPISPVATMFLETAGICGILYSMHSVWPKK